MDPLYVALDGHIVLTGFAPDGDSVRFQPRDPSRLTALRRAAYLKEGRGAYPGSLQLRLEGIDAPELHYHGAPRQPQSEGARDALFAWLGLDPRAIAYAADRATITSATPNGIPVTVLANAVDPYGRIIAYVIRERAGAGDPARAASLPKRCRLGEGIVRASANYALVDRGDAYFLAYSSLASTARTLLRDAARNARAASRGVWRTDRTARDIHVGRGEDSFGPEGTLVFPKLYRRLVDYFADRRVGFGGSFVDWLTGHGSNGDAKPDRVSLGNAANILLASLVTHVGHRIALDADVLDLTFVEE